MTRRRTYTRRDYTTPLPTDAELAVTHTQLRLLTSGQFVARNRCESEQVAVCSPLEDWTKVQAGGLR